MNPRLSHLRSLSRKALLGEIRKASDDHNLVLWEMVPYGAIWVAVRAGPIAAARLGIKRGAVIGYYPDGIGSRTEDLTPKGSAIGDMFNVIRQESPPHPDPFTIPTPG